MLNEVLIGSQNNLRGDYDLHSIWVEILSKSYGNVDLAACLSRVNSQPSDIVTYFIPKGDILTLVKSRQHALLWADGEPNRGIFCTSFKLNSETASQAGLFDSDRKLLDRIIIPAGTSGPNQSYTRISDGAVDWKVKGKDKDKYVTLSMDNKTLDSNAKVEKFEEHDSAGIGVSTSAMNAAFYGLILLFIAFRVVGKVTVNLSKCSAMRAKGIDKVEVKELSQVPGEIYTIISMALHEMQDKVRDMEEAVLAITRVERNYSPWSSKIYTLCENPNRK